MFNNQRLIISVLKQNYSVKTLVLKLVGNTSNWYKIIQ